MTPRSWAAPLVGGLRGTGDLLADPERLVHGERPSSQALGERLARHQFQDEVTRAAHFIEAMDGGDVRVVERRQQPSLAIEPGQPPGIMSPVIAQDLDADWAFELNVAGAEDPAHASRSDGAEDLVMAKPSTLRQLHLPCASISEFD
jgi:hypothetical protein